MFDNPETEIADLKNQLADKTQERAVVAEVLRRFKEYEGTPASPAPKRIPDSQWEEYQTNAQAHFKSDLAVMTVEAKLAHKEFLLGQVKELDNGFDWNAAAKAFIFNSRELTAEEYEKITMPLPDGIPEVKGQTPRALVIRAAFSGIDRATQPNVVDDGIQPNALVENHKKFGGAQSLVSIMSSDTGNDLSVPNVDATAQTGVLISETTEFVDATHKLNTPVPGTTTMKDYLYSSKEVTATIQFLRDASFNFQEWAEGALLTRLWRAMEAHLTTGTGTAQPEGIANGVKNGVTTSTSGVLKWNELVDLMGEIDDGYLMDGQPGHGLGNGGRIAFAMNKKTFTLLEKLADADQRPLYLPGLHDMAMPTFNGAPIQRVYGLPDPDASNVPILYGNFGYHVCRHIGQVRTLVFADSYQFARENKVGFLAFAECDGRWVQAKTASKITAVQSLTIKT